MDDSLNHRESNGMATETFIGSYIMKKIQINKKLNQHGLFFFSWWKKCKMNLKCLKSLERLGMGPLQWYGDNVLPVDIRTDPGIPASCCTSPQTGTGAHGQRTSYSRPDSGTGHCGSICQRNNGYFSGRWVRTCYSRPDIVAVRGQREIANISVGRDIYFCTSLNNYSLHFLKLKWVK
jgi:hypothetical protein